MDSVSSTVTTTWCLIGLMQLATYGTPANRYSKLQDTTGIPSWHYSLKRDMWYMPPTVRPSLIIIVEICCVVFQATKFNYFQLYYIVPQKDCCFVDCCISLIENWNVINVMTEFIVNNHSLRKLYRLLLHYIKDVFVVKFLHNTFQLSLSYCFMSLRLFAVKHV